MGYYIFLKCHHQITELTSLKKNVTAAKVREDSMQAIIETLKNDTAAQQTTIANQQSTINSLHNQLNNQLTTVTSQHNNITNLHNNLATLSSNVATLSTDVASLHHVEHGVLDCESSSSYHDGRVLHQGGYSYHISRRITMTFSSKYTAPPVVFLSTSFRFVKKGNNVFYGTKLLEVTTTNFTMMCGGDDESDDFVGDMDVDWISIPV